MDARAARRDDAAPAASPFPASPVTPATLEGSARLQFRCRPGIAGLERLLQQHRHRADAGGHRAPQAAPRAVVVRVPRPLHRPLRDGAGRHRRRQAAPGRGRHRLPLHGERGLHRLCRAADRLPLLPCRPAVDAQAGRKHRSPLLRHRARGALPGSPGAAHADDRRVPRGAGPARSGRGGTRLAPADPEEEVVGADARQAVQAQPRAVLHDLLRHRPLPLVRRQRRLQRNLRAARRRAAGTTRGRTCYLLQFGFRFPCARCCSARATIALHEAGASSGAARAWPSSVWRASRREAAERLAREDDGGAFAEDV